MSFSDWLRVTTFCDCEEWCVHAEVQRLAAQQHEALVELRRTILRHSPCMVHEDCAPAEEQATAAIQAGEELKEKYE